MLDELRAKGALGIAHALATGLNTLRHSWAAPTLRDIVAQLDDEPVRDQVLALMRKTEWKGPDLLRMAALFLTLVILDDSDGKTENGHG